MSDFKLPDNVQKIADKLSALAYMHHHSEADVVTLLVAVNELAAQVHDLACDYGDIVYETVAHLTNGNRQQYGTSHPTRSAAHAYIKHLSYVKALRWEIVAVRRHVCETINMKDCSQCEGTGRESGRHWYTCDTCNGSGMVHP